MKQKVTVSPSLLFTDLTDDESVGSKLSSKDQGSVGNRRNCSPLGRSKLESLSKKIINYRTMKPIGMTRH